MKRKNWRRSTVFLLAVIQLFIIILIIRDLFTFQPVLGESVYTNGVFPIIRGFLNLIAGLFPFSSTYILLPVIIVLLFWGLRNLRKLRLWTSLEWTAGLLLFILILFYVLWGFNYTRKSPESLFQLQSIKVDSTHLLKEIVRVEQKIQKLEWARYDFMNQQDHIRHNQILTAKKNIENTLRQILSSVQVDMPGPVPLRFIYPKGVLLGFGASGIYFPLSGEANVDPGLPYDLQPFVIAHELSHAYGFTDEGTCNFLAYLVCQQQSDPFLQYSGELQYLRHLLGNYRRNNQASYKNVWGDLAPKTKKILIQIRKELDKYPEWMPTLRPLIYDQYLKSQGIHEGMANYSKIIQLWAAYAKKHPEGLEN